MTTSPSGLPPANWYPDPQAPGQLRYWDGQRWTQHVHQLEQQPAQAAGGFAPPGPQTVGKPHNEADLQSDAGTYTPVVQPSPLSSARAHAGGGATGPPTGGTFVPTGATAAGPATGDTSTPTGNQGTGGGFPPTGQTATLHPDSTGSAAPGATMASPGVLQAPKPRDLNEDDLSGGSSSSPLPLFAVLLGVAACGIDALGILDIMGDYGQYWHWAGAGLGFVAVFFGFLGRKKVVGFVGGTILAWIGVFAGFVSITASTYEFMYPDQLHNRFVEDS